MMKRTQTGILLLIATSAFAVAQNKQQVSKPRPAAEMQRLAKMLVGKWAVVEEESLSSLATVGGSQREHSV